MSLKKYDNIKIPENLNEYIDKGIEKGVNYKSRSHNKRLIKIASVFFIGTILLAGASNVPVVAKQLIKVPILGDVVKILSINNYYEGGGMITDGNTVVIDSLENETVDIYFTKDNTLVKETPHYEIEYREYPYTIVITFDGVRDIFNTYVQQNVKSLPWIKDIYNIVTLDDSRRKIAIELNENIEFKITEYERPAMIQIDNNGVKNIENKQGYFVRTDEKSYGEEIAQIEERLQAYDNSAIQKLSNGNFIVQMGPFETEEEAKEQLDKLNEEGNLITNFYIEVRNIGEGPKIN